MAKGTRSKGAGKQAEELEPDELPEADYIPPDLDFLEKREELLGEGGGSINIYREGPGGFRDLTFVKSFALTEFEPALLQAPPFNGGRFRIHMRGKTGIVANFLFKVESDPSAAPAAPANQAGSNVTVQPPDMAALIVAMQAGFAKLGEMVIAASQRPATPPISFKDMLDFAGRFAPAAQQPVNPFGVLSGLGDALDVLAKFRGGRGDGESDSVLGVFGRALEKVAEPLGAIVAKAAEKRMSTAAPALEAPAHIQASEAVPMDMQTALAQYGGFLMDAARTNKDPATYAQMVLDYADEDVVREFVKRPDWFETVAAAIPDALKHRAWFEEFHQVLYDALLTPPEDQNKIDDPQPAPDNAAASGPK